MIFETHLLNGSLAPSIQSIFYYKDFQPQHKIERVVPTGHSFLIFELDGMMRNTFDNNTLQPNADFKEVWYSGMHKNYLSISAHPDSEMLVVQFKPQGAYPFFHQPINQYNDKVIPAEQIFGASILNTRKAILNESKTEKKFEVIEKWLTNRFQESLIPNEALTNIVMAMQEQPQVPLHQVTADFPNSHKHLIDEFKKYCGLTPKIYHRILRFNEILQLIHKKEKISWSNIAYQCGYTDQSHFIKEFKAFSGFNPQEFIKLDYNKTEPNFFPLDGEG